MTPKREAFARAVATGMTQAAAYRAAFSTKGMNAKTVTEEASRLAARPDVSAMIKGLKAAAADVAVLKAADILEETRRIALSTPAGIIDKATGKVLLPHELDAATAASIAAFEIDDLGRIKYRFWDKNQSLERASKMLGLFEKDNLQRNPLVSLLERLDGRVVAPGAELDFGDDDD